MRLLPPLLAVTLPLFPLLATAQPAAAPAPPRVGPPVALHPENPKYFLFRGKPLVLVTATEHYGSVINRRFDFRKYLDDVADKKMTLTRTFLLYRELQTARNPWSPLKPDSPDYLAPYRRRGPGKARDGEPLFDLDAWDPEYFARLRRFLRLASEQSVVVELTLFSHTYNDQIWALNPLRAGNNLQGVGGVAWPEYDSLTDKALVARQAAFARKVVRETCPFDNVYYEVCNEPAGGVLKHVGTREVDAWQREMARVVRDELRKQGRPHLVFGTQAFDVPALSQEFTASFAGPLWDAVNVHPNPYLRWRGRRYDLGNFMSRELRLQQLVSFCQAVHPENRPVVLDEDNAASLYRDEVGWTIHRQRAWAAVLSGAHYDYIDFSVTVGHEAGTAASRRAIRLWMRHLSDFIHSFDFVHARPLPDLVAGKAAPLVAAALGVQGKDYAVYLADGREAGDPAAGRPVQGAVSLRLPAGPFRVSLYSPTTGAYSPAVVVPGGGATRVELPAFRHDLVIRATRTGEG
jgi:hypothetical protein